MITLKPIKIFRFVIRITVSNLDERPDYIDNKDLQTILKEVSFRHDISINDMKGKSRLTHIKVARWEAMERIKNELFLTNGQIGKIFGGRDESTVCHALNSLESDREIKSKISFNHYKN